MLRKIDMARKSSLRSNLRRDEARGGFRAARARGRGRGGPGGGALAPLVLLGAALPAYGPRFPALGSGAHDSGGPHIVRYRTLDTLWRVRLRRSVSPRTRHSSHSGHVTTHARRTRVCRPCHVFGLAIAYLTHASFGRLRQLSGDLQVRSANLRPPDPRALRVADDIDLFAAQMEDVVAVLVP